MTAPGRLLPGEYWKPFLAWPFPAGRAPTRPPERSRGASQSLKSSPSDGLEQLDVVGEGGQQRLALLPAERLPLAGVRAAGTARAGGWPRSRPCLGAAGRPRRWPASRARRRGGQRALRVGGDVLPRDLGQQPGLDPEEGADLVEGGGRVVDQPPVAEHQHLVAREQRERVRRAARRTGPAPCSARTRPSRPRSAAPPRRRRGRSRRSAPGRPTTGGSSWSARARPGRG